MKRIFFAAITSLALAPAAFAEQPNLFHCESARGHIKVGYSSSSFTGAPTFSLTINGQDVVHGPQSQNIVDLSQTQSPLGTIVAVDVIRPFIADAPSLVYALVVPGIQMGDAHEVEFDTWLLQGINGGFMPLPAVYQRINSTTKLKCKAQAVLF